MDNQKFKSKTREWLKRYIPAEILGTICALIAASVVYSNTHSYISAAASGWFGEGVGFYGYFITFELLSNSKRYENHTLFKKIRLAVGAASTNLIIEFIPAEILDNFIIRPYLMFIVPQYIKPYALGFLVGKFGADILFYLLAIVGYETRKRLLHR
jgi:hypothetical protein